ncbi:4,5-DOPA dioxygenase extradiol [Undibacterium fentianense]|uniref:4,5-DOPA dioxygenase extradiol n=1 Tax=Undibacterium fentianense TaxID=2828728 RepID=A0A941E363_9BURK|nr:4,5-DOPA dioxygenase extradiol [Undibacterium fentianense]MBR7800377.1 4,5-DOPA dioxygenase extradiol [Undibacterium fentianense]
MSSTIQPAIFVGHGSPMNALEENAFTREWHAIGARFPKPKAILAISAHWMTTSVAVTAMEYPETIHDFGGFPPALFAARYPAPGSPALAQRVADCLAPIAVMQDQSWGLDHGTWSVLMKMFPQADIPVVQLSLNLHEPAEFHFQLGQRLASLRDEGIMLLASGNIVHNLRRLDPRITAYDWAQRFDRAIQGAIRDEKFSTVIDYPSFGNDALLSVPTVEHYLPLLYVLGAKRAGETIDICNDELVMGSISMTTVVVHAPS